MIWPRRLRLMLEMSAPTMPTSLEVANRTLIYMWRAATKQFEV